LAVLLAQQVFEQDAQRVGKLRQRDALLLKRLQAVDLVGFAVAGESGFAAKAVHRNHVSCVVTKQFEVRLKAHRASAGMRPREGNASSGGRQSSGEESAA